MAVSSGSSDDGIILNIMPLLDVFSILVTFLLMAYSTDPISYDPNAGLELPESMTISALDEQPVVAVTKTDILISNKIVAKIVNGDVEKKARSQGAIFPVYEELAKLAESNKRLKRRRNETKKIDSITMEMDMNHNFKLMKRVMLSGQQAEFVVFKLMVLRNSQ